MGKNTDQNFDTSIEITNATNPRYCVLVLLEMVREFDESLANSIESEFEPLDWGLRDVHFYSKREEQPYIAQLLPGDSVEHPFWAGPGALRMQAELITVINENLPTGVHFSGTKRNPDGMAFWTEERK